MTRQFIHGRNLHRKTINASTEIRGFISTSNYVTLSTTTFDTILNNTLQLAPIQLSVRHSFIQAYLIFLVPKILILLAGDDNLVMQQFEWPLVISFSFSERVVLKTISCKKTFKLDDAKAIEMPFRFCVNGRSCFKTSANIETWGLFVEPSY